MPTDDKLVLHARVLRGAGGGPDKTILHSTRFLQDRGYSMLCAYMRDPDDADFADFERRAEALSAPLIAMDDRGPLDLGIVSRARRLCERYRPVIWHGHDYKSNLLGLLVRKDSSLRLVTTVHGWVHRTWKTPLYYAIDRLCLPHYDQVICVSEDLHARCLGLGVSSDRCRLVPNAIDTGLYRRSQPSRAKLGKPDVSDRNWIVGAAGRLSPEKGFDLLIRTVHRLIAQGTPVELWIIGEGAQRPELERLIRELGVGRNVKLLGFRHDIAGLMEEMDIFVLSSVREGLPNVLLEAMALELPVVATRIAGVPSLIHDTENGLLVAPGSERAIQSALERLLIDPEERHRLGRAARATVEGSFSFRARMEQVGDIYDLVLGEGSRGQP